MKKRNFSKFNQQGFGLIEAVVGIIVALIIIIAFTTLISGAVRYSSINEKRLKAELYLQELVEVAKDLEQSTTTWPNWESTTFEQCNSSTPAVCYPIASGTTWTLISTSTGSGETLENNYTRWLTIEDVYRKDADNEIIDLPCGADPCTLSTTTKKVIANIEWKEAPGKTATATLESYLYNYNP